MMGNRVIVIRLSGKAHIVFKTIALLARYKGNMTLGEIANARD